MKADLPEPVQDAIDSGEGTLTWSGCCSAIPRDQGSLTHYVEGRFGLDLWRWRDDALPGEIPNTVVSLLLFPEDAHALAMSILAALGDTN